jgi:hypothetical protein
MVRPTGVSVTITAELTAFLVGVGTRTWELAPPAEVWA